MEDTTIEDVLKTFQDFYLQKDYPNALLTLQKHQNELPAGLLHFNLGITYGKMQNWPLARFHFMKAENSGLYSEDLKLNQNLVESKLDLSQAEKAIDFKDYLIKGSLGASEGLLTTLSLLMLVLGVFLLRKQPSVKKVALLLCLTLLPLGVNYWVSSWPKKIVTQVLTLYSGPSAIFEVKGEVPPGVLVLTATSGDWEKIIYPSRFEGWIKQSGLKRLE